MTARHSISAGFVDVHGLPGAIAMSVLPSRSRGLVVAAWRDFIFKGTVDVASRAYLVWAASRMPVEATREKGYGMTKS